MKIYIASEHSHLLPTMRVRIGELVKHDSDFNGVEFDIECDAFHTYIEDAPCDITGAVMLGFVHSIIEESGAR